MWRYIVQSALSGDFLEWDLPLEVEEMSWQLNGAGTLRGTVAPDVGQYRTASGDLVLQEWGVFIYAEKDGVIRWGGILTRSGFEGKAWSVEASSFTTYLYGLPYTGSPWSRIGVDPLDAAREVWRHAQSFPTGNLGMVLDSTKSPVRIGTPKVTKYDPKKGKTVTVAEAEPYVLAWYEAVDCGDEFDNLADETPFEYAETHSWASATSQTITHRLRLGYPRLGRDRTTDLAFIQGENVVSVVTATRDGEEFANEVVAIGTGQGVKTLRTTKAVRDGRLRRARVFTDKSTKTTARLQKQAEVVLRTHRDVLEVTSVEVVDHPHAPLASWQLGDDILVQATLPWVGEVRLRSRVVGWSLTGENSARLDLRRADSFDYFGGAS
jgi:hypothetical protein